MEKWGGGRNAKRKAMGESFNSASFILIRGEKDILGKDLLCELENKKLGLEVP